MVHYFVLFQEKVGDIGKMHLDQNPFFSPMIQHSNHKPPLGAIGLTFQIDTNQGHLIDTYPTLSSDPTILFWRNKPGKSSE